VGDCVAKYWRVGEPRDEKKWRVWRKRVFMRDMYTCQDCGSKKDLHPHHIKPFYYFIGSRYVVDNGVTLCKKCHLCVEEKRREMGLVWRNCHRFDRVMKKKDKIYKFDWRHNRWVETTIPAKVTNIIKSAEIVIPINVGGGWEMLEPFYNPTSYTTPTQRRSKDSWRNKKVEKIVKRYGHLWSK